MKEALVPLAHAPGHAQVDFGQCIGIIGGVRTVMHVFCSDLPHSDAPFVKAYPAETTEAFLDGHVSAFSFFGGVPVSIPVPASQVARIRAWVKYGTTGRHAVDFCGATVDETKRILRTD